MFHSSTIGLRGIVKRHYECELLGQVDGWLLALLLHVLYKAKQESKRFWTYDGFLGGFLQVSCRFPSSELPRHVSAAHLHYHAFSAGLGTPRGMLLGSHAVHHETSVKSGGQRSFAGGVSGSSIVGDSFRIMPRVARHVVVERLDQIVFDIVWHVLANGVDVVAAAGHVTRIVRDAHAALVCPSKEIIGSRPSGKDSLSIAIHIPGPRVGAIGSKGSLLGGGLVCRSEHMPGSVVNL